MFIYHMSEHFVEVYIKKFYKMTCVAFSLDGQQIATGSQNGRTYIWDTNTQKIIKELHDYDSAVSHLTYSKNGRLLATGSVDEDKVCIWNMETEERIRLEEPIESINSFAFSIDGQYIATGADRNLQIWNTSNGELLYSLEAGGNPLVAFSLTTVACCSQDASIQLWDAVEGTILHDIRPAHEDLITAIAINGTTLMTVSDDGYIKLWNIELAVETLLFITRYYNFTAVSFSPDGNSIATACSRRNDDDDDDDDDDIVVPLPLVVLFDITQGKISDRIILPDRSDSIDVLEYCQDGRLMGFGGMDRSEPATATQVIIWDSFPVAHVAPVEPFADLYVEQDTGFNVGDDDDDDDDFPGAYRSQGFIPAERIRQILRSNLAGKKQKQTKNKNKKQTKNKNKKQTKNNKNKKQTKNHKNHKNNKNKKQTKNHKNKKQI